MGNLKLFGQTWTPCWISAPPKKYLWIRPLKKTKEMAPPGEAGAERHQCLQRPESNFSLYFMTLSIDQVYKNFESNRRADYSLILLLDNAFLQK